MYLVTNPHALFHKEPASRGLPLGSPRSNTGCTPLDLLFRKSAWGLARVQRPFKQWYNQGNFFL